MPAGSWIPSLLSNSAICSDSSFVSVDILLLCHLCDWKVTLLNLLSAFIRADCRLKLYRQNPLSVVIWILSVLIVPSFDTIWGMSRFDRQCYESYWYLHWYLLWQSLHNMSQGSSCTSAAAASSSGMCSAVSCGQVMSKDVLYSDDWYNVFLVWFNK